LKVLAGPSADAFGSAQYFFYSQMVILQKQEHISIKTLELSADKPFTTYV
jgi:hypothetical protein